MKNYSAFDIMGPIMVGPSSSHTAGAARLGKIARIIAGGSIKSVELQLHGSFAKTYKGHGTDRALAAGILGMEPWDERLRNALQLAEKEGIKIIFSEIDLGDVHPNTVKFILRKDNGTLVEVLGSSIGGGSIIIYEIDGEKVEFTGEYPTIIIKQKDIPGVISKVTTLMYEENINIAFMKVYRNSKGTIATMIFETDSAITGAMIEKMKAVESIISVRVINPIEEGE